MSGLQLQPQRAELAHWTALAGQEGYTFEIAEPSLFFGEDFTGATAEYRSSGLVTSLHGAFIDVNPASGDPDFCALSRKRCEESCRLAVQLGADAVVFHSSCFPNLRGAYMAHWADTCAAYFSDLAERYPLTLYIENSFDTDSIPLYELMKRKTSPRVQVCLDLGHINTSREPMAKWFETLAEHIGYLHLSDNHGYWDEHLPLGSGTVDWQEADCLWQRIGKPQRLTLEVGGLAQVQQSIAYLKAHQLFGQR